MTTPNEIQSKSNRISWVNDKFQEIKIDALYNLLPEKFEAIILSGIPEQHNSSQDLNSYGQGFEAQNDNRYYFVRIMPLKIQGAILPDPFKAISLAIAKRIINAYPLAYIEVNNTIHPPTHGDIYECRLTSKDKRGITLIRRLRNSNQKIGELSNREIHKAFNLGSPLLMSSVGFVPTGVYDAPEITGIGDVGIANEWGLTPNKAIYNGAYLPKGTEVYNGFPEKGNIVLQIPDPRYFQLTGGGNGAIIKDHIEDFNRMCEHFHNDFKRKFRASGHRPFQAQIDVRKNHVENGTCSSMTGASGGSCKSAKPGTSNHGWAMAVDIKDKNGAALKFSSEEYTWLTRHAATYNFYHPSWAKEGGSLPEPWHWEVSPDVRVLKVL